MQLPIRIVVIRVRLDLRRLVPGQVIPVPGCGDGHDTALRVVLGDLQADIVCGHLKAERIRVRMVGHFGIQDVCGVPLCVGRHLQSACRRQAPCRQVCGKLHRLTGIIVPILPV